MWLHHFQWWIHLRLRQVCKSRWCTWWLTWGNFQRDEQKWFITVTLRKGCPSCSIFLLHKKKLMWLHHFQGMGQIHLKLRQVLLILMMHLMTYLRKLPRWWTKMVYRGHLKKRLSLIVQSSSSHSRTKSQVWCEFDSWLDTIWCHFKNSYPSNLSSCVNFVFKVNSALTFQVKLF